MTDRLGRYLAGTVGVLLAAGTLFSGCQAVGGGSKTKLPNRIIVWEDPETGNQNPSIRDANNDSERIVVVGTNGRVQFVSDGSVCTDCMVEGATIDVGGNLIDIRFGVGADPVADDGRHAFLVDQASGNFVQLVGGGGSDITFQVTTAGLEDPNDSSDDLAIAAGDTANPTLNTSSNSRTSPLCGALGGMFPVLVMGLAMLRLTRRQR